MQQPPFDAHVRVGKGIRVLAQHGRLRVADGVLTLLDSKGKTIATSPVEKVEASRLTFPLMGLRLTVDGEKFNLDAAVRRWRRRWFGPGGAISETSKLPATFVSYLDIAKQGNG